MEEGYSCPASGIASGWASWCSNIALSSSEVWTPSFLKMEYLCALAVEGEMPKALAM